MAITYPRSLPSGHWFQTFDMRISDTSAFNILANGAVQEIELAEPLWMLDAATRPVVEKSDMAMWQAWLASLRGGRQFLAYNPARAYPFAYGESVLDLLRAGGGAFDGTATLASYTTSTVTLSGLPAAYEASVGDMLSFPWNGGRALHQVLEAVTADGAGIAELTVDPPVRSSPAPEEDATVGLIRATCVMRIVPGSASCPDSTDFSPVEFKAVQVIT